MMLSWIDDNTQLYSTMVIRRNEREREGEGEAERTEGQSETQDKRPHFGSIMSTRALDE